MTSRESRLASSPLASLRRGARFGHSRGGQSASPVSGVTPSVASWFSRRGPPARGGRMTDEEPGEIAKSAKRAVVLEVDQVEIADGACVGALRAHPLLAASLPPHTSLGETRRHLPGDAPPRLRPHHLARRQLGASTGIGSLGRRRRLPNSSARGRRVVREAPDRVLDVTERVRLRARPRGSPAARRERCPDEARDDHPVLAALPRAP